jgi:adenine-specific DNA methylase
VPKAIELNSITTGPNKIVCDAAIGTGITSRRADKTTWYIVYICSFS